MFDTLQKSTNLTVSSDSYNLNQQATVLKVQEICPQQFVVIKLQLVQYLHIFHTLDTCNTETELNSFEKQNVV